MKSLFTRLKAGPSTSTSRSSGKKGEKGESSAATSSTNALPLPLPLKSSSRNSSVAHLHTDPPSDAPDPTPSRSNSDPSILEVVDEEDVGIMSNRNGRTPPFHNDVAESHSKKVTFEPLNKDTSAEEEMDVLRPLDSQRPASRGSLSKPPRSPTKRVSSLPSVPLGIPSRTNLSSSSTASPSSPVKSSIMSPTPSESSLMSNRSYLPPPNSWSEMAEDDLIANLGPKERTRQEVLWEIVSSEERYVQDLLQLRDTFCQHLLPSSSATPSLSLYDPIQTLSRTLSPPLSPTAGPSLHPSNLRDESFDFLPIAAKYSSISNMSRSPSEEPKYTSAISGESSARTEAYSRLTYGRPNQLSSSSGIKGKSSSSTLPDKLRSHQSLPPPPRSFSRSNDHPNHPSFSASYTRMSSGSSRVASGSSTRSVLNAPTVELPEDLEKVLQVLSGGVFEGHVKLANDLRKRYENQYPLVRSLADVFNAHSYILREYATYVLHLEKALAQVEEALSLALQPINKRHSRQLENTPVGKLGKHLLSLEELAVERGESGLVISLSKPFQRLLKYPLLFQNLLFNTDPSLREYEATLAMVDEVELIVRTIEDEKADSEEREKARDAWARIEGVEKDKMLVAPKPTRLLIHESHISPEQSDLKDDPKQKKSFRRLSSILKGNDHDDLWVIRFSDVSLLCEKIGVTSLPTTSKSKRSPDPNIDSSRAKRSRRATSVPPRNLYRFVKVQEWHVQAQTLADSIPQATGVDEDVKEDIDATPKKPKSTRVSGHLPLPPLPSTPASPGRTPIKVPMKTADGPSSGAKLRRKGSDTDTLMSDRRSVMSFAFKGGDQMKPTRIRPKSHHPGITITPSPRKPKADGNGTAAIQRRDSQGHMSGSAANAKFANRLRNTATDGDIKAQEGEVTVKAINKSRRSLPPAMVLGNKAGASAGGEVKNGGGGALSPTDRNNTVPKPSTAARPPWNGGLPKKSSGDIRPEGLKGKVSAPPAVTAMRKSKESATVNGSASPRKSMPIQGKVGSGGRSFRGKI